MRLIFDERVEPIFNSLHVVDLSGRRVDDGNEHVAGTGGIVEVGLKPLDPGQYIVLWRVNSADGHQVQGQFGFGVQAPPPDEAAMQNFVVSEKSSFWKCSNIAVKWLSLTALTIWLGGIFFVLVIATPAASDALDPIDHRSYTIVRSATLLFLLAQLVGLAVQAVTFADLPLAQSISPSILSGVLFTTTFGQWWLARFAGAIVLALLCLAKLPGRSSASQARSLWTGISAGLLGAFLLLTVPLTGHAHAVPRAAWLAVACDWAHLAATAVWVGGLVHFLASLRFINRDETSGLDLLGRFARRFSQTAKISVIILFATGIYAAWLHLPSWASFVTTSYGLVLLAKLIVIVPILAIAALNLRRVVPVLSNIAGQLDVARSWANRFRGLLRAETTLALLILVLVAVLTNLPPASAVSAGPMNLTQSTPQAVVSISLSPNKTGENYVTVSLQDAARHRITDAKQVVVYLQMRDMDMGLETVPATFAPDGTYRASVNLSMVGRWSLKVQVSPARGDDFVANFYFSSEM